MVWIWQDTSQSNWSLVAERPVIFCCLEVAFDLGLGDQGGIGTAYLGEEFGSASRKMNFG